MNIATVLKQQNPKFVPYPAAIYSPGYNCWQQQKAKAFSLIIDGANYYGALYDAIVKARQSLFILGWDIDSRIELKRGRDIEPGMPTQLFDLLRWKARQNPNFQIYLNRWDYTIYQAAEREGLSLLRWKLFSPANIHFHLDNHHPMGACHHQKIVVIDDEIAFCGGMDIALGRWDRRSHHTRNSHRVDAGGTYQPRTSFPYDPHHDVMAVLAGPAARVLGMLARERWERATGRPAISLMPEKNDNEFVSWPENIGHDFSDVSLAIARTMPPMADAPALREIEHLYIDEIKQAKNFIYIENQYLTSDDVALALNHQLQREPKLRVLMVSCFDPQGVMERKAMWGGRVRFYDCVRNGVEDRVQIAYPMCREQGHEKPVRIHSKLMIVDDIILHIGSANLNNRSLYLDSECDLSLTASTVAERNMIAARRNDLIREHTGLELDRIARLVDDEGKCEEFLTYRSESTQHLCRANDEPYRHQYYTDLAIRIADPKKPFFPMSESENRGHSLCLTILALLLIAVALAWRYTPLAHYAYPARIVELLQHFHNSFWTDIAVVGLYVGATAIFFPLTILVLATSMSFTPWHAFTLAFIGMMCSACSGYALGSVAGGRFLRFFAGGAAKKINHIIGKGGLAGVTLVRLMPIAPLGVVDFTLGMTHIPFWTYLTGTILGLLPGITVLTFFGHSLARLWHQRHTEDLLYVAAGIAAWAGLVTLSHYIVRRWQARHDNVVV